MSVLTHKLWFALRRSYDCSDEQVKIRLAAKL